MDTLNQDLLEINASTVRMLSQVREAAGLAQQALIQADLEAAQKCFEGDDAIDKLMRQLEKQILIIIARRQPAARDLRFLGAIYRSLADIERAGDYAVRGGTAPPPESWPRSRR